jgi:HTH-type transcriptional regulator/antitoxin HipB
MASANEKIPSGNLFAIDGQALRSTAELGELVRRQRKQQTLNQSDLAGLGNTGNRFIVELERGKPTLQLQKVMDVLDLLGLELVVRPRTGGRL